MVVCGHSLGRGVKALLAMHLRSLWEGGSANPLY